MVDLTVPGHEEIVLRDMMRKAGLDSKSAAEFLKFEGVTGLVPGAKPQFVISQRVDGRVFIDFGTKEAAELVRRVLLARGIEATVDTSPEVPKNSSSLYFDGIHLEQFIAKTHGDFTTDPNAFSKIFGDTLNIIIKENQRYPATNLDGIRANNLLREAAHLKPPFTAQEAQHVAAILREAGERMRWAGRVHHSAVRDVLEDKVFELSYKLSALADLGTAPRSEVIKNGIRSYKVDEAGHFIETGTMTNGFSPEGFFGHKKEYPDFTLPATQALPQFTTAERAEYERYYQLFKVDGMNEKIAGQYNGTLAQLLAELTNPRSPMAVALKQATFDAKGQAENPIEQAVLLEQEIRNVYEIASRTNPNRADILESWRNNGEPWLGISGHTCQRIIDAADKAPKDQLTEEQLAPYAATILRNIVGAGALNPRAHEAPLPAGPGNWQPQGMHP